MKQSKRDRDDETVKLVGDKENFIDCEDMMELAALEAGGRAFQLLQNKVPELSAASLDNFRKESIRLVFLKHPKDAKVLASDDSFKTLAMQQEWLNEER